MTFFAFRKVIFLVGILIFTSIATAKDQNNANQSLSRFNNTLDLNNYASKAEEKLSFGQYQEAAWLYDLMGIQDRSVEIIQLLKKIFDSQHIYEEKWAKGVAKSVILTFSDTHQNLVKGIFKPMNADPYCERCNQGRAIAAYELDRAFGFYLTPLTMKYEFQPETKVICDYLELEWREDNKRCAQTRGSIQYFLSNVQTAANLIDDGGTFNKSEKFHLFDTIIGNSDRHLNNILLNENFREIAIDHNRTFMFTKENYEIEHNSCWEAEIDKIYFPDNLAPYIEKYINITNNDIIAIISPYLDENDQKSFINARQKIANRLLTKMFGTDDEYRLLGYIACPHVKIPILTKDYIE